MYLPCLARRDTIYPVQLAKQHTVCIELDSGRHANSEEAGKEPGRMEGGTEEARGGWGGREGSRGGREEAMMLGGERASVEEGRVDGGWVDEGTE